MLDKPTCDAPSVNPIIGAERKCSTCKKIKNINDFYFDIRGKDGRAYRCSSCRREDARERAKKNPEKTRRGFIAWEKRNPVKTKNLVAEWKKKHRPRWKEICLKSSRKIQGTPKGKLNLNMRSSVRRALRCKKNGVSWKNLVGYNLEDLKKHLEKQFKDGMAWNNYGEWHIDHIIPISAFNFEKPEDDDFKRCWALKNLQPMWARENYSKNNKLDKPFQPGLIFKDWQRI